MNFKLLARDFISLCQRMKGVVKKYGLDIVSIAIIVVLAVTVFAPTKHSEDQPGAETTTETEPPSTQLDNAEIERIANDEAHQKANDADFEKQQQAEIAAQNTPEAIIRRVFGEDAEMALAIAKAESGLNPLADNGKCIGIFQIMLFPSRPSRAELYDPEINIITAKKIFDDSGWSPWSVYKSGAYKKYL